MNLLQIVNTLKVESGRSGGPIASVVDATGSDARLVSWARNAWTRLQNDRTWKWMRQVGTGTIVDGQASYTPATFSAAGLRGWVVNDDAYQPSIVPAAQTQPVAFLRQISFQMARQLFLRTPHMPAAPQYWAEADDRSLVICPTPLGDWDLTIDYWAGNTSLTNDTDEPNMPSEFHMILVWMALMDVGSYDNAPDVYARAREHYLEMWGPLKDSQDIPMSLKPLRMG